MFVALKKVVLLVIFVCLQYTVSATRREFPTCRSRDTCIRLTNCVPYMNLIKSLKKPLSRASVLFLRKQECGFDGMYPMVCCFPSNTRRTQGNKYNSLDNKDVPNKAPNYFVPSFQYNTEGQPEEPHHPLKRPDFTFSDLSDYRSFKDQDTNKFIPVDNSNDKVETFLVDTSTLKSSTEAIKTTTRLFRRKAKINFNLNEPITTQSPPTQSEETKNKRAEKMKRKIEAINNAFMYSTMDYFFVRRMDDENRKADK